MLYDHFQNYTLAFRICGALMAASAIPLIIVVVMKKKKVEVIEHRVEEVEMDNENETDTETNEEVLEIMYQQDQSKYNNRDNASTSIT